MTHIRLLKTLGAAGAVCSLSIFSACGPTVAGGSKSSAGLSGTALPPAAQVANNIFLVPFDEAAGASTFSELYSAAAVGSCSGTCPTAGVSGHDGTAVQFNGTSDSISMPASALPALTGDFTIAAWIKTSGSIADGKVIGNQNGSTGGFKFGVFSNKLEIEIRSSTNTSTSTRGQYTATTLTPGVWYHIAGTYSPSGQYMKTYINGVLEGTYSTTAVLGQISSPIIIGREPFASMLYFYGAIDDLAIFSRALSDAEVLSLSQQ